MTDNESVSYVAPANGTDSLVISGFADATADDDLAISTGATDSAGPPTGPPDDGTDASTVTGLDEPAPSVWNASG